MTQFQTGDLDGTAVTISNGQTIALRGVTVTLSGNGITPQIQVTDATGNYRYFSLAPGTYDVKGELAGFSTTTAPATITVGETTDQTLTLQPSVVSIKKEK